MSEEMVPVCNSFLGNKNICQIINSSSQKESIMISAVTIQQSWNMFPMVRGFFPNAKLYCVNLDNFDKQNQC